MGNRILRHQKNYIACTKSPFEFPNAMTLLKQQQNRCYNLLFFISDEILRTPRRLIVAATSDGMTQKEPCFYFSTPILNIT